MHLKTPFSTSTLWRINTILAFIVVLISVLLLPNLQRKKSDLVPQDAILVMDGNYTPEQPMYLPFWRSACKAITNFNLPDSLNNFQVSVHQIGKIDFDFLYYFEESEIGEPTVKEGNKEFIQEYENLVIHQVLTPEGGYKYGWVLDEEMVILSQSNLLLERYIDSKSRAKRLNFKWNMQGELEAKRGQLQSMSLQSALSSFSAQSLQGFKAFMGNVFPQNPEILMYPKLKETFGLISGERLKNDAFENIYGGQNSKNWNIQNLIPQNTSLLIKTSVDQPKLLNANYHKYQKAKDPRHETRLDSTLGVLDIDLQEFVNHLNGKELYLEYGEQGRKEKVLILGSENAVLFEEYLKRVATQARKLRASTSEFRFAYRERNIYSLNAPNIFETLLNNQYTGLDELFFMRFSSYLLFSNERSALISYLLQIENQNFETTISEVDSTSMLFARISPSKIWTGVYENSTAGWREFIERQQSTFNGLNHVDISVKNTETRISLYPNRGVRNFKEQQWKKLGSVPVNHNSSLHFQNFVIYTTKDRKLGVLDKREGRVVFEKYSEIKALTNFKRIDFLEDGGDELIIANEKSLYLLAIEGDGGARERALVNHKSSIIDFAVVSDGIYFIDSIGEVYFYDKRSFHSEGIALTKPPVNPKKVLIFEKQGVRKLLTLGDNGMLYQHYATSGIPVKGFPKLAFNAKPAAMILEQDLENDRLRLVSKLGNIRVFDLLTEQFIEEDIQLERGSKFKEFEVKWDQSHNDWLLIRRGTDDILLLNKNRNPIINVAQPYGVPIEFLWIQGELGNKFLCIFDGKTNRLFDLKGQKIGEKNVETTGLPIVYHKDDSLFMLSPLKSSLQVWMITSK